LLSHPRIMEHIGQGQIVSIVDDTQFAYVVTGHRVVLRAVQWALEKRSMSTESLDKGSPYKGQVRCQRGSRSSPLPDAPLLDACIGAPLSPLSLARASLRHSACTAQRRDLRRVEARLGEDHIRVLAEAGRGTPQRRWRGGVAGGMAQIAQAPT